MTRRGRQFVQILLVAEAKLISTGLQTQSDSGQCGMHVVIQSKIGTKKLFPP